MTSLSVYLAKLKTRPALIGIVGVLLVLNLGRLAVGKYQEIRAGIESKQALLGQYQLSTQNLEELRSKVRKLEAQQRQFEQVLFEGESREDITSSMQIKLQELLSRSGMNPESLRPTGRAEKDTDKLYGDITIKMRISGNLEGLLRFFAEIYRLNYFFKIENFTLKPYKNDELKVFVEVKGFYKLKQAAKA